jgi:hypothetical protein
MKKCALILSIMGLALFLARTLPAQEEPKYTNESFARLSFISGNVYIQQGTDVGYEDGVVNMPIEEGNRVGTTEGRAEIYLGRRNYLRLDNNTKLDLVNLPKKDSDLIRLRIWNGSVYLSVNRLDKEKTLEVHTPDSSFYVLAEGLYRIDVQEDNKTEIYVFRGIVEVAGEEGSLLLKSEQSIGVQEGRFSSRPVRFLAVAEDGFDRWNESRDSSLRVELAERRLPEELEDFEGELAENGDWSYFEPYGWVWAPGGMGPDWRPYYNGSWMWLSLGGWTWLPYEPWGWVTCHYGRWGWGAGLGWYWMPTTFWGPAWVGWWWGADYYGWAPLGWGGMPVAIIDNFYYPNWNGAYYPYNSRALTVVHKDQLRAKNISGVAMRPEALKGLDKITLTPQTSSLKPAGNAISADGSDGKKGTVNRGPGVLVPSDGRTIQSPASGKRPEPMNPKTVRSPEKGDQGGSAIGERRIRREGSFGYPPSPAISLKKYPGESLVNKSSTFRNNFYKYLQGNRSSSRGSIAKGSSTSGSKGRVSSPSRGSSSGSRSSAPRSGGGGSIHKKN